MFGLSRCKEIARTEFKIDLHQCAQSSVIDTTNSLSTQTKRKLALGMKYVGLHSSEKKSCALEIARILGAQLLDDNSIAIPEQRQKKLILGPYIGIDQQTLIQPYDPAKIIKLPHLHSDAKIPRPKNCTGIFKKADKGSSIVFLSRQSYNEAALKHLKTNNYSLVDDNDATEERSIQELESLLEDTQRHGPPHLKKLISSITTAASRTKRIYFLPKIHKPLDEDQLFKIRPIVDCRNTALSTADQAIAKFLSKLNPHLSTIATSSIDLLQSIRAIDTSHLQACFYTADVADLYTNVPINEAIGHIRLLLDEFQIGKPDERELAIRILAICLENNFFKFGDQRFQQKHGIPMGSNSAPIVADAFLYALERHIPETTSVLLFKRYRDDIFALTTSPEAAMSLDNKYKQLHPRIKLESQWSTEKAEVLDIKLAKFEDGSIRTGVFFKATNNLPLLHRRSNHPLATLHGAIKGRFINFLRICNNTSDLMSAFLSLIQNSTKFGYREEEIIKIANEAIKQCSNLPWPYLKESRRECKRDYRTNNIVTYCRNLEPIYDLARKRKYRLAFREGKNTISTLSRTADC